VSNTQPQSVPLALINARSATTPLYGPIIIRAASANGAIDFISVVAGIIPSIAVHDAT